MDIKNQKPLNSDDAQALNDLNNIKAQMSSSTPADYQRLVEAIEGLASNPNISSELRRSMESMKSTIENRRQNARTVQISNDTQATLESRDSRDFPNEFIRMENDIREKELIVHKAEFNEFKEEFRQSLNDTNNLLKKVADGADLTVEEKEKLSSANSGPEDATLSKRWKTTYQILDKAVACTEYAENQIKEIDKELAHPDTSKERSEQLLGSKAKHKEKIEEHQCCLRNDIKPCIDAREEEREHLHSCVNNGKHEVVKHHIKGHCKRHIEHYKREHSRNPNSKCLHEMCEVIKKSGLHKEDKECEKHLSDMEKHLESTKENLSTGKNAGKKEIYSEHKTDTPTRPSRTPPVQKKDPVTSVKSR